MQRCQCEQHQSSSVRSHEQMQLLERFLRTKFSLHFLRRMVMSEKVPVSCSKPPDAFYAFEALSRSKTKTP